MSASLESWLDLLCCPIEHARLRITKAQQLCGGVAIQVATLACECCGREFLVSDGVVRSFDTPGRSSDSEAKQKEIQARDAAAETYDHDFTARRNTLEIDPSLKAMKPLANDTVVELGCGTGRVTMRYAPLVSRVVALDFSLNSLLVLQRKIPPELRAKLLLVQADVCAPPLVTRAFTKAVSFQVFEHLPTIESRRKALTEVTRLLWPGGTFTCSVYHWSKQKRKHAAQGIGDNTLKEGFHNTNIYYYNFEEQEFRELLQAAGMEVELLKGLQIRFRGSRWLGPLEVPTNRLLSRTRWGIQRSALILARARCPMPCS
jgi:ubiquinone/menaquinone biosynthesis C-methylase UbiE/uncharacterized protein YbaR (Trm112 family)